MNSKFNVKDIVMVKRTGTIKPINEIVSTHIKKVNVDGSVTDIQTTKYLLHGFIATYYNEDELVLAGMSKETEQEIDKIIIDSYLSLKRFDLLKQFLDSDTPKANGRCVCGGELWDVYFHNHTGYRCSKCNTIFK